MYVTVACFRDEFVPRFRDGFHHDSGADRELVVGHDGFEVAGVAGAVGVLGAEKIGGRGLGIDGVEIGEAEGVGVEGRGEQRHAARPVAEGGADLAGINDELVDDAGAHQRGGNAEASRAGSDNEDAGAGGVDHEAVALRAACSNQEMTSSR
jgi:hypothetical protein